MLYSVIITLLAVYYNWTHKSVWSLDNMKSIMIETWNHLQTWKWTFLKRYIVSRRIHIGSTFFGALFFQYLIPISNGIILLLDS